MKPAVDPIEIPPRLRVDSIGYGSAVIGLPRIGAALMAVLAGHAVRCLRIDSSGRVTVVPKVRGLLRSAVPESDDRLWLLTTHGLQLLDLESNQVVDTIRAGIPDYPLRLNRLDEKHLVVSKRGGQVATVVSESTRTVTRRFRMPCVDLVLADDGLTLCSFEQGLARRVDADWRRIGNDVPLSIAVAPLRIGGAIAAVLARAEPAAPGSDVTVPRSRGIAAIFDVGLSLRLERVVPGIERIDARTLDARLLGVTRETVVVLDAANLEELGRTPALGSWLSAASLGPGHAVALFGGPKSTPSVVSIRW